MLALMNDGFGFDVMAAKAQKTPVHIVALGGTHFYLYCEFLEVRVPQ